MVRIGLHVESSGVEQLYATSFRAHQTFAAHVVQDADDNLAHRPDGTSELVLAGPRDQLRAHLLLCCQVEQMPGFLVAGFSAEQLDAHEDRGQGVIEVVGHSAGK